MNTYPHGSPRRATTSVRVWALALISAVAAGCQTPTPPAPNPGHSAPSAQSPPRQTAESPPDRSKPTSSAEKLDERGRNALHDAAYAGDLARIRQLVASGANLELKETTYGHTPMLLALEFGKSEAAQLLIQLGANLKGSVGHRALELAARGGDKKVVQMLLATVTARGTDALNEAARYGYADVAKLLIDAGADVNRANKRDHDFTPLIYACTKAQLNVAKVLVEHGASLSAVDNDGRTPLHWAVSANSPSHTHMYRKMGGPHDTIVTVRKQAPLVAYLCGKGASLTAKDKEGNTPLHAAAIYNAPAAARELLKCGATKSVKNAKGETPKSIAAQRKNAVLDVLK